MNDCPAGRDLERFVGAGLEEARAADLAAHLATCARCRSSVEDLRADQDLLAEVARVLAADGPLPGPAPGATVAGFRLERQLGHGGMGAVWLAEQQRPKRKVAFKIVRPVRLSGRALRQLEAESDALARLQHRGIAQVFAAGQFDLGFGVQPWFAMELVAGQPLLEHCAGLDLRARVRVVAEICEAVHHAHQKGVLHRDLKPGNVMVTADGQPKVLDFGVARVEGNPGGPAAAGGLVGTPSAMSPEQAAGEADFDVRADTWSLGALACQVLAGETPHRLTGLDEMAAVRFAAAAEPRPVRAYAPGLPTDLAAVLDKAVRRGRDARYQSAAELAADLRRFLAREPVTARPATLAYQLRLLARRHVVAVVGLVAVLATALAGTWSTWAQARRAAANEADARAQLVVARGMADFLQEVLIQASTSEQGKGVATIDDALDVALARVDAELVGQPEVEAAVRHVLGEILLSRHEFAAAEPHLRRALALRESLHGPVHRQVAYVLSHLAQALIAQGRIDEAEALLARALGMRELLSGSHAFVLGGLLDRLAHAHYTRGRLADAVAAVREAIDVFSGLPDLRLRRANVAVSSGNLALFLMRLGDAAAAEQLLRQVIEEEREVLGPEVPQLATALVHLAELLAGRGEHRAAEPRLRQAVAIRDAKLGAGHAATAHARLAHGCCLAELGELDQAEPVLQAALTAFRDLDDGDGVRRAKAALAGLGVGARR